MGWLYDLLLRVSNALLIPDLLAALALALLVLGETGALLAELVARARRRGPLGAFIRALHAPSAEARRAALVAHLRLSPLPQGIAYRLAALGEAAWRAPPRERALERAGLDVERSLGRLMFCVRLGPMVGLIGTLIPLGPGLTALAQGDVAQMASHLTVAFTVTVVGLATGALGFVLASVRRSLGQRDLAELSFIAAELEAQSGAPRAAEGSHAA